MCSEGFIHPIYRGLMSYMDHSEVYGASDHLIPNLLHPALPPPQIQMNTCKLLILDLNRTLSTPCTPLHIHLNSPNTKPKYLPLNNHILNPNSNNATTSPSPTSTPPTPIHIVLVCSMLLPGMVGKCFNVEQVRVG